MRNYISNLIGRFLQTYLTTSNNILRDHYYFQSNIKFYKEYNLYCLTHHDIIIDNEKIIEYNRESYII